MNIIKFINLNENLTKTYGEILHSIHSYIKDNAKIESNDSKLLSSIFNKEKSLNWAESNIGLTGFGDMDIVEELSTGKTDSVVETWQKVIEHFDYSNECVISRRILEDSKFGSLTKAKKMYSQFFASYARTQAKMGIAALTGGEAGLLSKTYAFGSKNDYNRCTGDGEAVFSTSHKNMKTGKTHSNVYSNELDAEGVLLDYLVNEGRNFPDESGENTGYLFDTIIIPGNRPALESKAKALKRKINGSNSYGQNVQEGPFKLIIATYWKADADTGILMSSEANNDYGNIIYDYAPLHIYEDMNINEDVTLAALASWEFGFYDWRHLLAWGVEGGKELTIY